MHYAAIGSTVFALLGTLVAVHWLPGKRPAGTEAPSATQEPDLLLADA
jgi:DHA2 family multidrug resistance protein-like MFS transporter